MKKFLIAILALLYLSTTIGATVQMHYCMGQLSDWGIGHKAPKTCGKCGMEKSEKNDNGCCKDEHKFVKNDTDQKTAEAGLQLLHAVAVALPVSFIEFPSNHFPSVTEENPISHAPPQSNGVAVYIRNCVFLV
ncbi:MAG: hypothetical protein H7Z13_03650 [Ferruginibacter sp.]|nr:hypothetical protein [Ferruginibacter sp.]